MRAATLVVLLLACGCNGLLALDDVERNTVDIDRDGVRDSADNCKGVANPGQEDVDVDGIGDACDLFTCDEPALSVNRDADGDGIDDGCDACMRPGVNDEDADGMPDACDVCPEVADPMQLDSDKDGIGDACDLHPDSAQERVIFDGFGTADPHDWIDPLWMVVDGAVTTHVLVEEASVNNAVVFDAAWSVEVSIDVASLATTNDRAGILLMDNLSDGQSCGVSFDGSAFVLGLAGTVSPFAVGKPAAVPPGSTVVIRLTAASTKSWICELVGGEKIVGTTSSPGMRVRLYATPSMKMRYVDVTR